MTEGEQLLARAFAIATRAHHAQTDKAGAPYLGHPVRVSAAVDELDAKVVGLLHDVVEDSEITLDDLARGHVAGALEHQMLQQVRPA